MKTAGPIARLKKAIKWFGCTFMIRVQGGLSSTFILPLNRIKGHGEV